MKRLIWYGAAATALGFVAAISGQEEITGNSSSSSSYLPTTKLVGRKIKSSQGEEIGVIKDVVLDLSNGCMAYTVVSTGNAETGGGKIVVVPWAIYSPTSHASTFRVKVDRDKIYNAPLFDYARMDEYVRPDYADNVYKYYGIPAGALSAVAASKKTTAATDVTGTAGATASPGEVAPTTTAEMSSPSNRASTHSHATPAASQDRTATNNGSEEATRSTRSTGTRRLPTDREEGASSTTTEEPLSKSTPSENKKSRGKGTEETSTGTRSETPHSSEGDE